MGFLNQQKADLFDAVVKFGFSPNQFRLEEAEGATPGGKLLFDDGKYHFSLERQTNGAVNDGRPFWQVTSAPGQVTPEQSERASRWTPHVLVVASKWLTRLRSELNTVDPWQALSSQERPAFHAAEQRNTPMSFSEWERAAKGIEDIKNLVLQNAKGKDEEAIKQISAQLDSVIESGKRMGRVDWLNLTLGCMMNILMAVGASPEVQNRAWGILQLAVSGTVELLPTLVESLPRLSF